MVVYGQDSISKRGMDEMSISGETKVCEFTGSSRQEYIIHPEDLGLRVMPFDQVASMGEPAKEALRFIQVLSGKGHQACVDFTCLNAGAILYTAGKCDDLKKGVELSREIIESNRAIEKLRRWATVQDSSASTGTQRLESLLAKV
jgi:anthranilate phosphoribosyltransferase